MNTGRSEGGLAPLKRPCPRSNCRVCCTSTLRDRPSPESFQQSPATSKHHVLVDTKPFRSGRTIRSGPRCGSDIFTCQEAIQIAARTSGTTNSGQYRFAASCRRTRVQTLAVVQGEIWFDIQHNRHGSAHCHRE